MGKVNWTDVKVGQLYMARQIYRWGEKYDGEIMLVLCDSTGSLMMFGSDVGGRPSDFEFLSEVHIVEVIEDDEA